MLGGQKPSHRNDNGQNDRHNHNPKLVGNFSGYLFHRQADKYGDAQDDRRNRHHVHQKIRVVHSDLPMERNSFEELLARTRRPT